MSTENPHAGQGAVALDIGGDIGALVVSMPPAMEGLEVEIRPFGHQPEPHSHDEPGHRNGHGHEHSHSDRPGLGHLLHVAVVARPMPDGTLLHSLVFPELVEGEYELYQRPAGPVQLTVTIRGGEVASADWPGLPAS